jgi:hypothetical protein
MKVDRRGRVHVPVARREALLDEFERSGASAPEFAGLVGVKYATFAGWRAQRARARAAAGSAVPAAPGLAVAGPRRAVPFLEAVVEAPGPGAGSGLAVELPGGGRVLVSAAAHLPWVAELLRLLSQTGGRPC